MAVSRTTNVQMQTGRLLLAEEIEALKALVPSAVEKQLDILLHLLASNAADDFPIFSTALKITLYDACHY